jgi:hypothetical protein
MSLRERLTLAAALAVALATSALAPVYDGYGWVVRVLGVVAVVGVTGLVVRRLSVPVLLHAPLLVVAVGLYTALAFARDTLALGLVPVGATLDRLRALVDAGAADVEVLAPPVPTTPGLVLLAVLGVGAIAVVTDVIAVGLGRAAVAGLPLLLLFAVPSAVLADGLGWLPFVLTAAGWLGLLLVEGSDRVGRWGAPLRSAARAGSRDDASLGRVGRRIGAAALGVAVAVPAVLPGLDARLLDGGSGEGIGGGGGRTGTVYNPITRLYGDLRLPEPRVLFTYTTDDPDPDYVRLTTLDVYRDGQWSSSNLNGDPEDDAVETIPRPVGLTTAPTREFAMRMAIRGLETKWLPVPATPTSVDVPGRWVWDEEAETVFSAQDDTTELDDDYDLTGVRAVPAPGSLTEVGPLPEQVSAYDDEVALTEDVTRLLQEVVAGKDSDFDKVLALQDFFRGESFSYDVEAERAPAGRDPIDWFLSQRKGFCEQYASAMAALVRGLGLPARVAVGFTRGSREGEIWTVTTNEAHAWPEVWFEGAGWVRFEPTPRASATTTPAYASPQTPGGTTDPGTGSQPTAAPTATASAAPGTTDPRFQEDPTQGPGALEDPSAGAGGASLPSLPVLLGLLALVLLAVPAVAGVLRRRSRGRLAGPLPAWSQLHDDATDVGHLWRPADSPRLAASRLAAERRLTGAPLEALERLALAAERTRFAPPGAPEAGAFGSDVATVRHALLAAAPARVRWRARLLPPSTVRWGAHLLGERTADLLDAVDDAVAAVTRRLRLRSS